MDGNITSPSEALREPQVRGSGAGQHAIKEMEYAAGILPHPRLHYSLHVSAPPGGWQAAVRHDYATTLSSLDAAVVTRRRRRVTSFAFLSGGAPAGASLHLRLPLRRRWPGAADCIYGRPTAPTRRPALPASSAHLRRDVQLGFRRRLRRRRPRLGDPPGPGPTACGPDHRHMWRRRVGT